MAVSPYTGGYTGSAGRFWSILNHSWLLQAVKNKYASSRLLKISTIPQLNSRTIKDLASPLMGRP